VNATDLVKDYFQLWATTDDEQRHRLVGKVFATTATQYVAPADITLQGAEAIEANIARVNRENIQTAGLHFRHGATTPNHNSVQVEWEVADSSGNTVGTGRDFLLLDDNGRVTALYMFRGQ
jgi:hypothetical protein